MVIEKKVMNYFRITLHFPKIIRIFDLKTIGS